MTNLDKIKACARAMEIVVELWPETRTSPAEWWIPGDGNNHSKRYDPLRNSTQADALEGWLLERGIITTNGHAFTYSFYGKPLYEWIFEADMTLPENRRRARVECVAKMMEGV